MLFICFINFWLLLGLLVLIRLVIVDFAKIEFVFLLNRILISIICMLRNIFAFYAAIYVNFLVNGHP